MRIVRHKKAVLMPLQRWKPLRRGQPAPAADMHATRRSRRSLMIGAETGNANGLLQSWPRKTAAIITLILFAQSLLQLPFFKLTTIDIRGLENTPAAEVLTTIDEDLTRGRWVFFKNSNFFLFKSSTLANHLAQKHLLNVVRISRRFPNRLVVEVHERISGFVLQTPEKYIRVDSDAEWVGTVQKPLETETVIADERTLTGSAVPLKYVEKITLIKKEWDDALIDVQIEKFHLTDNASKIELSVNSGFRVYFSPERDIKRQITDFVVVYRDTTIAPPKEYVDLRFDGIIVK